MSARNLQFAAVLLLGGLLGFGVASYRAFMPGQLAQAAQDETAPKKKDAGGIFSPPGTTDTGPVTPPPGQPPFKGKIGQTIAESIPDWPPQATAPLGILTSCTSSSMMLVSRPSAATAPPSARRLIWTNWPRMACATITSTRPPFARRADLAS